MARKAKRTRETEEEGLFILRPPKLGGARDVAKYLDGEFAATLRTVFDLLSAKAHCPVILLDDLAYVAKAMARVLRGKGAATFEDESFGFTEELIRSLRELTARLDGTSYESDEGGAELWDSTLPTLSRMIGRAETELRVETERRERAAAGVS